jgi:hypothetical protein
LEAVLPGAAGESGKGLPVGGKRIAGFADASVAPAEAGADLS